jgi:hypothetical protein
MRDEVLALAADIDDPVRKLNVMREYMQAFVLRCLHESEAFSRLAFVGGTALRFLENLPRYSEDLDFSLLDARGYAPQRWLKKVKAELELAGFACSMRWNDRKTVNTAWIGLAGLLHQAGLASRQERKLSIKLEIDTRPPEGAGVARTVIHRHLTFVVCHYDLRSLMAGKVHALWVRPYPKGRDWFDLIWYRAHRPPIEPNIRMLQNALDQTEGPGRDAARQWRTRLRDKLSALDAQELVRDVAPFLERPADGALLSARGLASALGKP